MFHSCGCEEITFVGCVDEPFPSEDFSGDGLEGEDAIATFENRTGFVDWRVSQDGKVVVRYDAFEEVLCDVGFDAPDGLLVRRSGVGRYGCVPEVLLLLPAPSGVVAVV